MENPESIRRFATALDHLGSQHPVVRIGCFAELDRLARDDPDYIQPVADVVCAYLRMPFDPPPYDHTPEPIPSPAIPNEPPMSQDPRL
jgi:hypothetical protein